MTAIKDLKKGDFFTIKDIAEPKASQVWVKFQWDCSLHAWECIRFDDINRCKYLSPDTLVYTDFTF